MMMIKVKLIDNEQDKNINNFSDKAYNEYKHEHSFKI